MSLVAAKSAVPTNASVLNAGSNSLRSEVASEASNQTNDAEAHSQIPGSLKNQPETFWQRDTLLDDPGGWRSALDQHGIEFHPVFIADVMGNPAGGRRQGAVFDSGLNLPLTIRLDRLVPAWSGGTVHANAWWLAGRSLSEDYVGDVSSTSNVSGYDAWRLQEFWYQQDFANDLVKARAGLIAADNEFFTSDTASLFINGTFGAFTLVGDNLPNPPIYPMASPAFWLSIEPTPRFYFQAGVFKGDTGSQEENRSGLNYRFNSSDGVLVFSEMGWRMNSSENDDGWSGIYKVGSFVDTANFHNQATGAGAGPDFGIYAVADQQLYRHASRSISVFTRVGGAPAEINPIDWYVDAGLNFQGVIPGRPDDVLGVAFSRSWFSSNYSRSQVAGGSPPYSAETVLEATWQIQIRPWWTLQPDFQYIFNPSGRQGSADATVLGVRVSLAF